MGRTLLQIPDGVQWANKYAQQLIASWLGLDGDGTDAQLWGVPLQQTSVKDDTLFALDARNRVTPGNHIRATHSSGSPELFTVTDAGAAFNTSPSGVFAVGMIIMWFGSEGDCPEGWAICNGANSTPDLRDRFVVGAGSTYALGATGGATTYDVEHAHTSAAHAHAHTATHVHTGAVHTHVTAIDHNHAAVASDASGNSPVNVAAGALNVMGQSHTHNVDLPEHVANKTSGNSSAADTGAVAPGTSDSTTPTDTGAAGSTTQSVLPPYLGLFFIMRIAA